jgi:glycosyltransferase involved in cell wall biosynthesis
MTSSEPIRLTRVIARLNIGGPAIQAITLTKLLEPHGYATRLVRGVEGPDEGNMDYLADELGVVPTKVDSLTRDPGRNDLKALAELIRILRQDRPQIVHTHAAKAGTLGRLAAICAFPRRRHRPVLVHTFHGHSLTGYFSDRTAAMYRWIERVLARRTDVLVAVSADVRDDLVRLGVAPDHKFAVIPLGFDLSAFVDDRDRSDRRDRLRAEWGIGPHTELVTLIARLVPIKRVDRFLRVARTIAAERPQTRFAIVGDGELRAELAGSDAARDLADRLTWAGFRRDMPDICVASDVVMLTSDNEGTPVSLIEAQAAAVPVVGTDVGGVRSAVLDGQTGVLAAAEDERGLAAAVARILDDPELAGRYAAAGRAHASAAYAIDRLVADHDRLYRQLLSRARREPGA